MAIQQITLNSTFGLWVTATQALIDKQNYVEDSSNLIFVTANNVANVSNTINTTANLVYSTSNAVSNTANDIYAYVGTAYNVSNAVVISSGAAFGTANAAFDAANLAISVANTATSNIYTVAAYNHANSGYAVANTASIKATAAHLKANAAFNTANSASGVASSALTTGQAAFNKANASTVSVSTGIPTTTHLITTNVTSGNTQTVYVDLNDLTYNSSTRTLNAYNFNSLSDKNLKTDIIPLEDSLSIISKLTGVSYKWKFLGEGSKKAYGFIAQDVENVIPEIVSEDGPKSINYTSIIPFLVNAIQELQKEIEDLKDKLGK